MDTARPLETEPGPAAGTPADPAANARAPAVYARLVTAPERTDHRLVIGQALRGWDFDRPVDQPVTALTDAGLPAPGLVECDVTAFGVTAAHAQLHTVLRDHAAAGGLIGLSAHVDNPFTGGDVYDLDGVDLPQLADPANPATPAAER